MTLTGYPQVPLTDQERSQGYEEINAKTIIDNLDGYEEMSDDDTTAKNKGSPDGYEEISDDENDKNRTSSNAYEEVFESIKDSLDNYDEVCEDGEPNRNSVANHYELAMSIEPISDPTDPRYNAEPYFQPASEEEEVMTQLEHKLGVTWIPKENLKYVLVVSHRAFTYPLT